MTNAGSERVTSPLRLGARGEFARARAELLDAGFDEETVLRTLCISKMSEVGEVDLAAVDFTPAHERLALLIRTFIFFRSVPREEARRVLSPPALDSFLSLGLLAASDSGGESYYSPVWLYPVAGLLIASDRHNSPDGSDFIPPPDIVFPAIFSGTLDFLRLIPRGPAADALDLCAGAGVGALLMSRRARRAVASDITERATHFARFNALLNGCENVEAVCGDLYDGVTGQTFDRITAHPPYVPALRTDAIWRDGGETGEALTRRIVEGLPRHLRPGGTFYTMCFGLDTEGLRLEERVRSWLREKHAEFDIICAASLVRSPREVVLKVAELGEGLDAAEARRLEEAFERAGAVRAVNGALAVRRRPASSAAAPLTARVSWGDETAGDDFERAFDWHVRRSRPDFAEWLAGSRPRLSERLRVKVTHEVRGGELVPSEFVFETDKPFASAARLEPDMALVFARFDGGRTPAELYGEAGGARWIPAQVSLEEFTALVATMIERGYLTADDRA